MSTQAIPRTRPGRRAARLVLFAAAVLVVAVTGAEPAGAHGELVGSQPEADAELERPPEQVRVWFDEPVELLRGGLEVLGPDGIRVDLGDAGHGERPHELAISLAPPQLPAGRYTARYRVQTGDGHLQEGSWTFLVTEEPAGSAGAGPSTSAEDPSRGASAGAPRAGASDVGGQLAHDGEPDTRLPMATVGGSLLGGVLVAGLAALVLWRAGDLGRSEQRRSRA